MSPLRIMFATSEVYPLVKVGGLGDVSHALPKSLAALGHRVDLFVPRYAGMPEGRRCGEIEVTAGAVRATLEIADQGDFGGARYYTLGFLESTAWERPEGYVERNLASFVLFSRALGLLAQDPQWQPDVVHCNDWHVGHLPAYLAELGFPGSTVLTVHNLAFQGLFPHDKAMELGLTGYGAGNLLAQGIEHAHVVTTVSGHYRDETLVPRHGFGLDGLLRARGDDYVGVLNGVDYEEFNPLTDTHLPATFDVDAMAGKAVCKAELQKTSGLAVDPERPVLAFIARLAKQKGVELLLDLVDEIAASDLQLVVVGRGERFERAFRRASGYHENVAFHADNGEPIARLAYAGSDLFLAPSEFEPCGLAPLIAMRYGSVPVARKVGGMVQTVAQTGLGFAFTDRHDLMAVLRNAIVGHQSLRDRVMRARFTWDDAARHYERLYRREPTQ